MNGFLQDGNGNRSSMRVTFALATAFILAVWGIVSVRTNTMAPMPMEILGIIVALVTGKVTQGVLVEKKSDGT